MTQHEPPVFGRKVFFIEPQPSLKQAVIPRIIEREYEVYSIDSYQKAKNYLKGNPDSLVFCCISDSMSTAGWFNFIKSFEEDEVLSTMLIGVIAFRMMKSDRERFMIHCDLPAGYLELQPNPDAMTEMVINVLDLNDAMGRRKYVRADSSSDKSTYLSMKHNDRILNFPVDNISSVGLAFRCSAETATLFPDNSVIRGSILSVGGVTMPCDCAVIMQKSDAKGPMIVVLFMKGGSAHDKVHLHEYVAKRIQYCMDLRYEAMALDDTDYQTIVQKTTEEIDGAGLYSPSANVVYADDLDTGLLEELKALGDDTVVI